MVKRKYSIDDYAEFRTIKDWECKCCGKKMPAGSKRMLPRIRKWADYGICLSCFDKWKLNGGDIVYINNTSPRKQAPRIKKEHVIHMSNILKMMEEIGKQIIIYENRRTNNSIFSCEQEW